MAQNFWIAIVAWSACFAVTLIVSVVTRRKTDEELRGLVYGLTEIPRQVEPWFKRPGPLAAIVGAALLVLNVIFW
jgi:SSS family solute:Na+ symporter